jgi:hypothetical protein
VTPLREADSATLPMVSVPEEAGTDMTRVGSSGRDGRNPGPLGHADGSGGGGRENEAVASLPVKAR